MLKVLKKGRHRKTTTAKENKGNVTRAIKNSNGMKRGKTQVIGRSRHKNHDSQRNKGNVTRANKNSKGINRGKTQVIGRGRHKNHDSQRKQRKCHKS